MILRLRNTCTCTGSAEVYHERERELRERPPPQRGTNSNFSQENIVEAMLRPREQSKHVDQRVVSQTMSEDHPWRLVFVK